MLADYHVHTEFSYDSIYEMEKVVKDAITLGMDELCFTDHVDYGIKVDWDEGKEIIYRQGQPLANVDYPNYFKKIEMLQEKYKNQITIKKGMEFGIQKHTIPQFEKLYKRWDFDFVILSCHQVEDKEFWTQDFQKDRNQEEYQNRYYEEIWKVIHEYKNYSVLGHLDLLKRYDLHGEYPFEKIKPMVEKILKKVIEDRKGIEVNTSSFRYGLNDLMPSRNILKLYYELGGKIITIGSDTHKKEHLGAHIEDVKNELKRIGFKYYCTFENMNPIYHEL